MSVFWNDQEIVILKQMAKAGKNARQIRKVLTSRTENAIGKKAADLCLSLSGAEPMIDFEQFKKIMGEMEKPKCI